MSNGTEARATLIAEVGSAITDIKSAKPAGTCQAHAPVTRGLITLLRCERAHMERSLQLDEERIALERARQQAAARRRDDLRQATQRYLIAGVVTLGVIVLAELAGVGPVVRRLVAFVFG